MKTSAILFLFLVNALLSTGQSVGIGTNSPNASAILQVASNSKGVLLPAVYLQSGIDNTTVAQPAPNLLVFNMNTNLAGGKGLYFNANTAASPDWAKVGDLTLPYAKGTSTPNYAFNIQNYHASTSSIGIQGFCQNGVGVYGQSVAGTGVLATSSSGTALKVLGAVSISGSGQTPANGKVLTSDAAGNATWQGAIAFRSTGIQPGGAQEFSQYTEKKVPFYTQEYDLDDNYNPSTISPYSTFTAPVSGIYHFDIKTHWFDSEEGYASEMRLKVLSNGITKVVAYQLKGFELYWSSNELSTDIKLLAGDQVYVTLEQNQASVLTLSQSTIENYFNGRLVIAL